jgi:hypothetical protein
MTCKDCRWWELNEYEDEDTPLSYSRCNHKKLGRKADGRDSLYLDAFAGDVAWYAGPDFGCVHHQPKDGED